jgi:putative acetyltransferase
VVSSGSALKILEVDPQGGDALSLLREAAVEARALYPELVSGGAPWPMNPPTPPRGVYLLAYAGEKPIACGALRPLDESTAEVRRMFVTREARRIGAGRAILKELEVCARDLGYAVLRLETGNRQAAAMRLYESIGFHRIAPFGEYAGDPTSVCFEKAVAPKGRCGN